MNAVVSQIEPGIVTRRSFTSLADCLGASWSDVNLDAGQLCVAQTVTTVGWDKLVAGHRRRRWSADNSGLSRSRLTGNRDP